MTTHHANDEAKLAFLLSAIFSGKGRSLTQSQFKKKLTTKGAQKLGLSEDQDVLEAAVSSGLIQIRKRPRTTAYELTDIGAERLESLRSKLLIPAGGARGIKPPATEEIRELRTGFLLLQVLKASNTLSEVDANKQLDTYARETLELNVATAKHLRHELVRQGLLELKDTDTSTYCLSSAGLLKLGGHSFQRDHTFTLTGKVLNDLLEAGREVGSQFASENTSHASETTEADLWTAILSAFEELLRERHGVTRMVPIHEVRAVIRERVGENAARHDSFDDVVLSMRRDKHIRISPITDHGMATPDQLQASIPGLGETLFYMEPAHEPAAL